LRYYSKKKKSGKIRKILLSLLIIIVAVSLVDAVDIYRNRDKILPGVSALGVELEGLNREDVREILQPITLKLIDSPRILVFEDKEIKFIPHKELDAFIDFRTDSRGNLHYCPHRKYFQENKRQNCNLEKRI
jgi:vancomycin resistance protein VanW